MGHYKYASDEEAKEAYNRQRKNWIENYGRENYLALMRVQSLRCYYKNKEKHKYDPKPEPKKRGRPRIKPFVEKPITIKKSDLIEKIKQLEEIIRTNFKNNI